MPGSAPYIHSQPADLQLNYMYEVLSEYSGVDLQMPCIQHYRSSICTWKAGIELELYDPFSSIIRE
jgi:hypothetical protein